MTTEVDLVHRSTNYIVIWRSVRDFIHAACSLMDLVNNRPDHGLRMRILSICLRVIETVYELSGDLGKPSINLLSFYLVSRREYRILAA